MSRYSDGRVFRFRLTPEEEERLTAEANERGLSKADRIRQALGWEPSKPSSLEPGETSRTLFEGVPDHPVDPDDKPGLAAMQKLSQRVRERLPA